MTGVVLILCNADGKFVAASEGIIHDVSRVIFSVLTKMRDLRKHVQGLFVHMREITVSLAKY